MKKYMVLTMLAVTLGGVLTGCGAGKDIGQEEAEKIRKYLEDTYQWDCII